MENAKYLQDKFYNLSEKNNLNIFVDFGDIVSLHNKSRIDDFKAAINSYFKEYVSQDSPAKAKKKVPSPTNSNPQVQFFLVIIPDTLRQEHFYTALKNKINYDNPVIS